MRLSLSESLAAVVSQLLLPSRDGKGRVAANEILLRTSGLAEPDPRGQHADDRAR